MSDATPATPSDETPETPQDAAVEADVTEPTDEAEAAEQAETSQPEAADETPAAPAEIPDRLRMNDLVTGTVAKLVDFGAFVDVETAEGTVTGLVHVSEIAPGFVENIYAEIGEGDEVTVKVLSIGDDGKVGLSIKQAAPDWDEVAELDRPMRSKIDKDFDRRLRKFMHGSQSIQGEVRRQKRNKLGR